MSSKFMSPEEFASWSEKPGRTLAEIEAEAINQQAMLNGELLESAEVPFEQYAHAGQDERLMMLEKGAQVWMDEEDQKEAAERANDTDEQVAVQSEFCNAHPNRFPSAANGTLFRDTYIEQWQEANPGLPVFWEIGAMEAVFAALESEGAFEVERKFRE
jgi:hypothetical protein